MKDVCRTRDVQRLAPGAGGQHDVMWEVSALRPKPMSQIAISVSFQSCGESSTIE
jgi:hypothetical protein